MDEMRQTLFCLLLLHHFQVFLLILSHQLLPVQIQQVVIDIAK